jgi:hypothetical protein
MSVKVSMGTKKRTFKSVRLAADAAGVSYMTFYMRLRAGVKPVTAANRKVRVYTRKESV